MTTTPEIQVASVANQIISLGSSLYGIQQQITAVSAQWTNLGAATKLNAFPTAVLTSTGGLGTADGSPNTGHPINTGVVPGTEITRAISSNDIASLLTYLQGIASAIGGSAVSANGAAAQLLAQTV